MYLDIHQYLLIFLGWFIHNCSPLECVQCTSSLQRVSESNWDHSCLDATSLPLPCPEFENTTLNYKKCISSLYRFSHRKNAGVLIHRGCSRMHNPECDPANMTISLDTAIPFFCARTCNYDGCNRHSAKEIISNANQLSQYRFIFLYLLWILF